MSIDKIVFTLADKFPNKDWDLEETTINNGMYCILVNDYDFYMRDKKFRNWIKILRTKFPKVRFFTAYKNFKY